MISERQGRIKSHHVSNLLLLHQCPTCQRRDPDWVILISFGTNGIQCMPPVGRNNLDNSSYRCHLCSVLFRTALLRQAIQLMQFLQDRRLRAASHRLTVVPVCIAVLLMKGSLCRSSIWDAASCPLGSGTQDTATQWQSTPVLSPVEARQRSSRLPRYTHTPSTASRFPLLERPRFPE